MITIFQNWVQSYTDTTPNAHHIPLTTYTIHHTPHRPTPHTTYRTPPTPQTTYTTHHHTPRTPHTPHITYTTHHIHRTSLTPHITCTARHTSSHTTHTTQITTYHTPTHHTLLVHTAYHTHNGKVLSKWLVTRTLKPNYFPTILTDFYGRWVNNTKSYTFLRIHSDSERQCWLIHWTRDMRKLFLTPPCFR